MNLTRKLIDQFKVNICGKTMCQYTISLFCLLIQINYVVQGTVSANVVNDKVDPLKVGGFVSS